MTKSRRGPGFESASIHSTVVNHQLAETYRQKAQGNRSHKLGDGDGARHGSDRCNAAPAVYIKLDKDEMGLSSESRCPELKPASRIL